MTRADRLIEEFKVCRGPFPYKDAVKVLSQLGYSEKTTGGGSRRKFVHDKTKHILRFHSPHPGNELLLYVVKQLQDSLSEQGLI